MSVSDPRKAELDDVLRSIYALMALNVVFYDLFRLGIINICRYLRDTEGEIGAHFGGIVRVDFEDDVYLVVALADCCVYVGGIAQKLGKLYLGLDFIVIVGLFKLDSFGSECVYDFYPLTPLRRLRWEQYPK